MINYCVTCRESIKNIRSRIVKISDTFITPLKCDSFIKKFKQLEEINIKKFKELELEEINNKLTN